MTSKRIAVIDHELCNPNKCKLECKTICPAIKIGKLCIEVSSSSKSASVSENLCIGCGLCVKKCPFDALKIVKLPTGVEKDTAHSYGANSFSLHRLPVPRLGHVLGLVGANGTGKSTALKLLSGRKPNLGRRGTGAPSWQEVLSHFQGSGLHAYLTGILQNTINPSVKTQHIHHHSLHGFSVNQALHEADQKDRMMEACQAMGLNDLLNRYVEDLSGGELQRTLIAAASLKQAHAYIFDEPTTFLDIKQRIKAANYIRSLLKPDSYVIVSDHDLSTLDYLADFVCCVYGKPGAYGVVTLPFSVKEAINIFINGFIPTENVRFRDESLTFKVETPQVTDGDGEVRAYNYPQMTHTEHPFSLEVMAGEVKRSKILVLLGENGTGKSTFLRVLRQYWAGVVDRGSEEELVTSSYKPQDCLGLLQSEESVGDYLWNKIPGQYTCAEFVSLVIEPLEIEPLLGKAVKNLSGGELQRVMLVICLGTRADVYLIDEPSAHLDSEKMIKAAMVIKKFSAAMGVAVVVVDHDLTMATYLADEVMVFEGEPGRACYAGSSQSLVSGINSFLTHLNLTCRHDRTNYRPSINKLGSSLDTEQKASGKYFYLED